MKYELSIVILSYNVRKLLDNCLQSVFADPESKNWQVIVVDNASEDDTVDYLNNKYQITKNKQKLKGGSQKIIRTKRKKNELVLITSGKNCGFSAGNNLAVSHIKAAYTLFLNPDTEVPIGTIPRMLAYLKKNKRVGAATCKVLLSNGKLDDGCHRGFPTPWNSFCYFSGLSRLSRLSFLRKLSLVKLLTGYSMSHLDLDTVHEIDSLTGAFMMLPTKVGEEVGWWDEDYFFNAEDLDFCYRIREAGYRVMYVPDVEITHYKGASGGYKSSSHGKDTVSKEVKLKTARHSTEAMRVFYKKHYEDKYPKLVSWLTLGGIKLLEKYRVSKHTGLTGLLRE